MFPDFGGIEYVPPAISVRTAGDKSWHTSAESVNAARYNDFVPMVYGTAWYAPPVVFARNDGNLTHMEVLLGIGEMQGVRTVLVSGVQIPLGVAGTNMTGTGWYNVPTLGTRAGTQNPDFVDGSGRPAGDPYGSMAYLSVVVPNVLSDGATLPTVKVLVDGLKVPQYNTDGSPAGEQFTSNPAWILLDILRRTGWSADEIDIPSFTAAAAYCDEGINALNIYGDPITLPRFQCNLALKSQRSAGDLARGVRNCGRLLLTYGANGVVQVRVEDTIANQQPAQMAWSNSVEPLNGGWPSYEFGDGSNGFGGILRRASGEPWVRLYSRSLADTPNQIVVEFQDALNGYQQDSLSVVDPDDVALSGQVISVTLSAIGMPDYDQAARLLQLNLDKSLRGNTYIEFDTSVKSVGIRPGDIITITYLKEGFTRQPFRVLKIAPGTNHRVSTITAQIHDDAWYADSNGQPASAPGGGAQERRGSGHTAAAGGQRDGRERGEPVWNHGEFQPAIGRLGGDERLGELGPAGGKRTGGARRSAGEPDQQRDGRGIASRRPDAVLRLHGERRGRERKPAVVRGDGRDCERREPGDALRFEFCAGKPGLRRVPGNKVGQPVPNRDRPAAERAVHRHGPGAATHRAAGSEFRPCQFLLAPGTAAGTRRRR